MGTSSANTERTAAGKLAWPAAALLLLAAYVFLLRAPFVYERLNQDEGLFMAIAEQWRHGARLYRDFWDNKPPGIFAIYAAIQTTLGTGMVALNVAGSIVVFLTAVLTGMTATRVTGLATAGVVVAFALPAYTLDLGGEGLQPELAMLLPQSLAVWILTRFVCPVPTPQTAVATGLLFGLIEGALFEVKFPAALEAVALGTATLACLALNRAGLAAAAKFAGASIAAATLVPAVVMVGFKLSGGWPDLEYANFVSPRLYVTSPFGLDHPAASLMLLASRLSYFAPPALITLVFVVARAGDVRRQPRLHAPWLLPLAWLAAATVGAAASGYYRYYYFMSLAPAAVLLGGMSLATLVARRSGERATETPPGVAILCVLALAGPKLLEHQHKLRATMFDDGYRLQQALIPIIKANEPPGGGTMFLTDVTPGLYVLTGTTPATRYPQAIAHVFDLPEKFGIDPTKEIRDILARKPTLIVGTPKTLGPSARFYQSMHATLEADYDSVTPADTWLAERVLIYRIRRRAAGKDGPA